MSISLSTRITISSEVLFQELEGESVLLNLKNDHYYGLDDIGTSMWQSLSEHGEVASVLSELLGQYDVDEMTLRNDLVELITQMADVGLLTLEAEEGL